MKAWRMHGFGDLRLDDVPVPEVKPRWALVKVKVVQPSITELQGIEGFLYRSKTIKELKCGPITFGHECCGEVVELGKNVTTLKVGDRVCNTGKTHCGQCDMCLSGKIDECRSGMKIGSLEIPACFCRIYVLSRMGRSEDSRRSYGQ